MKTTYTVKYKRKRENKTNYKKRLNLLKSKQDILIIRKTNTQIITQIARYNKEGDKIMITTKSSELKKLGWTHSLKNTPAAYLTGLLIAKKAKQHKITNAILDLGLQTSLKGTKAYATLKGATDAGLKIPQNEEAYPKDNRIQGEHISKHLEKHKTITKDFEKIKETILK